MLQYESELAKTAKLVVEAPQAKFANVKIIETARWNIDTMGVLQFAWVLGAGTGNNLFENFFSQDDKLLLHFKQTEGKWDYTTTYALIRKADKWQVNYMGTQPKRFGE